MHIIGSVIFLGVIYAQKMPRYLKYEGSYGKKKRAKFELARRHRSKAKKELVKENDRARIAILLVE